MNVCKQRSKIYKKDGKNMKKRIISIIMAVMMLVTATVNCFAADDVENLQSKITSLQDKQLTFHILANMARDLGVAEEDSIIRGCSAHWWELQYEIEEIYAEISRIETEKAAIQLSTESAVKSDWPYYDLPQDIKDKYPDASYIWLACRNNIGLNQYCAAGLVGRAMHECGGTTLSLNVYQYVGGYYGAFAWWLPYTTLIYGDGIESQMQYMAETLEYNYRYFGGDYDYFLNCTDASTASYLYTIWYGRGGWSYQVGENAYYAYDVFAPIEFYVGE